MNIESLFPTPTRAALAQGLRNAAKQGHLYTAKRIAPESRVFWIQRKKNAETGYYVQTAHRTPEDRAKGFLSAVSCQCEAFQYVDPIGNRAGYCKHCAMVEEILEIERMELEFDEAEEGRSFMRHHHAEARI